jgi:L-rhamnose-H+ transport protein
MNSNPLFGLLLIAMGSVASASFYIPFRKVKNVAWEVYWIIGGIFSWIIVPWIAAMITVPNIMGVLHDVPSKDYIWPFIFGAMWGVGGLTFGLTLRYLGVSLGTAIALGIISALGTLIPPIFKGTIDGMFENMSSAAPLIGVIISFVGIAITGQAGILKDQEMSEEKKKETVKDFNLKKGLLVALLSGVMSACFNFGIEAGDSFSASAISHGAAEINKTNPVFIVIMTGGFLVNFIWCIILAIRNKTIGDYIKVKNTPYLANIMFAAIAGTIWFLQMMFFGMGRSQMGKFEFTAWSILMSLSIVFSTMFGFIMKEWAGSSKKIIRVIIIGLSILILSTVIIGMGPRLFE